MSQVSVTLTDEEHTARAMLMGMVYHHGNGDPVYYKVTSGLPELSSFIDANTLEPLVQQEGEQPRWMLPAGRRAYNAITDERIEGEIVHTLAKKARHAAMYKKGPMK